MPMTEQQRFTSMDALRALAMIWGVFYHALFSFAPMESQNWFAADIAKANWVDSLLFLSHIVRMPLFFMLAGFFALFLIEKRGGMAYLVNRFKRIFMPFLVCFIVLAPVWIFLMILAAKTSTEPTALVQTILSRDRSAPPSLSQLPIGHLWFLNYLFIYSLVFAAGYWLVNRLNINIKPVTTLLMGRPQTVFFALALLMAGLLALSPQLRVAAPPKGIVPELWSLGYYGIAFLIGACLFQQREQLSQVSTKRMAITGTIAVLLANAIFTLHIGHDSLLVSPLELQALGFISYALGALTLALALICGCWNHIRTLSKPMQYCCNSAYWLYIVHVPIMVFLQIKLQSVELPGLIKYAVILVATLTVSLLSYQLLIRMTPLGWLFHGRMKSRALKRTAVNSAIA